MSDDAVKQALEAAAMALCAAGPNELCPCSERRFEKRMCDYEWETSVTAIAAFLRALPEQVVFARMKDDGDGLQVCFRWGAEDFDDLASAVERASDERGER